MLCFGSADSKGDRRTIRGSADSARVRGRNSVGIGEHRP